MPNSRRPAATDDALDEDHRLILSFTLLLAVLIGGFALSLTAAEPDTTLIAAPAATR